MKRLAVLGSTGSIGVNTLRVVESFSDDFEIVALAAGRNLERLERQVRRFRPELVVVADAGRAAALEERLEGAARVAHGIDGLVAAARHPAADTMVSGLVGALGVHPTYAAADAGKRIALANKEALVVAGEHVMARARETGAVVLPVDSEHNAVHQCLRGERTAEVRRLWLTASGGPFLHREPGTLAAVTPDEAVRHPNWKMGRKISVDSATMMNKGLEVIEAHWLFGLPAEAIRVVVHPKSVVHSMVEFVDGSFKAQLGNADMQHAIQYALTWPERRATRLAPFDPVAAGALEFLDPDPQRFPCLPLAFRALRDGGAAPAVLNAANEVAVQSFLEGRSAFTDIPRAIERALERHAGDASGSVDELMAADRRARRAAARTLGREVGA